MTTSTSILDWSQLITTSENGMMIHPGLPPIWVEAVLSVMLLVSAWAIWAPASVTASQSSPNQPGPNPSNQGSILLPFFGQRLRTAITKPWLQFGLRIFVVIIFLAVIIAGLFGTPLAERNLATTLTWSLWWTGLIISIYFVGSAWCAVCPWDALANWLVRRHGWKRGNLTTSLNLRVPRQLRNIWPALFMFIGLTWLELGVGITTSPYGTAMLALFVVLLATVSLAVFERKAFCHYFCAVGRTIGFYSEVSPVALRPIDPDVCSRCKTLECYHGTKDIEPCPTYLVLGRMKQNTYCTSCGACAQSCPDKNVSWQLRKTGEEVIRTARPHWDEAWFIVGLVSLTSFHGITMLPAWEQWIRRLAQVIGDSGQLLWSFSFGMFVALLVPLVVFMLLTWITQKINKSEIEYKRLFSTLALAALPLAFAYHLAHNINHLVREGQGIGKVLLNPLGHGTQPLSMTEVHLRHLQPLLHQEVIFALQALLILFGFWLAVRVLRHRLTTLLPDDRTSIGYRILPVLVFISGVTLFNLWLLMQPMAMRM